MLQEIVLESLLPFGLCNLIFWGLLLCKYFQIYETKKSKIFGRIVLLIYSYRQTKTVK